MQTEGGTIHKFGETGLYRFGGFTLDPFQRQLFGPNGNELSLTPKTLDLLIILVKSEGRIMAKNELMSALWPDSFVEEANLAQTISMLRKVFGESPKDNRFIVTVQGHGYRFASDVQEIPKSDARRTHLRLVGGAGPPVADDPLAPSRNAIRFRRIGVITGTVLGVAILAVFAFVYQSRRSNEIAEADVPTIAILPFRNVGGSNEEEYVGRGLSEILISKLTNVRTIVVRPTGAVTKYAADKQDPQAIGRELKVASVVTGGVQRIGEDVRVTAQLVRVSDGAVIWAETYDDRFSNIFAVQDSISSRIVGSLAIKLTQGERDSMAKNYTANPEAYRRYLEGRFYWNKRTGGDLQKAARLFDEATRIDPNFALAYAGLASCYQLYPEYYLATTHDAFPNAKSAVKRALEIDDELAEAHAALAYIRAFYDWDFAAAEGSFRRAIDLNPNYATAHQWYAEFLMGLGRVDESFVHIERAMQIDPVSPIIMTDYVANYYYQHKYDEAIVHAKRLLELDQKFAYGHFYLGFSYEHKGQYSEASESLATSMVLFGEPAECAEEVREAFRKGGMRGWWKKRLEQVENRPHLKYFPSFSKAFVYARNGDKERAFEWLNKAYDDRERWMVGLNNTVDFDGLRDDPRFPELLTRIGIKN